MSSSVEPDPQSVGARILSRRRERGLSQRALAAEAGVTQAAVSLIERGECGVSRSVLVAVAGVLGCAPGDLAGRPVPDAVDVSEVLDGLATLRERQAAETADLVARARAVEVPWVTIAECLGVSRDTLRRRYPHL